jgi:hypothetical protein
MLLAASLFVVGCSRGQAESGGGLTADKFAQIRPNMACNDLVQLLGEPTERHMLPSMDADWIWKEGAKYIQVTVSPAGRVHTRGQRAVKRAQNLD